MQTISPYLARRRAAGPIRPAMLALGLAWLFGTGISNAYAAGSAAAGQTFLWLAIILVLARLAMLVERLGMPAVLGELLVGVLLGNLSLVGIGLFEKMGSDDVIAIFAELGVVILLFQIGLETRLEDMRRVGMRALAVAVIGVVAPFALGTWVVGPLLLPGQDFTAYLFLGATLTATSVGITGRVFRDLGALGSKEARIILGAAVIDDVLGLIILAVVSSLVRDGQVSAMQVAGITLQAVLFLGGSIWLGRFLAPYLGRGLAFISAGAAMKATLVISLGLLLAWLAHAMGLAAIVGAFAAGLLLEPVFLRDFDRSELESELRPLLAGLPAPQAQKLGDVLDHHAGNHHRELVEPLGYVFVPVFFVYTGMQVQLQTLADPAVIMVALGVTLAAVLGKIVAGVAAGDARRWLVGWGMVPRGEVGLIFAMAGRQLGVVDDRMFSVAVIMVMLTTLLTPPVLGRLLRNSIPRP